MAWLAAAAPYIAAAGTAVSVISQAEQGKIAAKNAAFEADQLAKQARGEFAESTRQAIERRREARFLASRAQAIAAASGGGADDPTVNKIIGDIEGRGEFNALNALYTGTSAYDKLMESAKQTRRQGQYSRSAARIGAATTAISGATSLAGYG